MLPSVEKTWKCIQIPAHPSAKAKISAGTEYCVEKEHPLVTSNTIGMIDRAMYNGTLSRSSSCTMKVCKGLVFNIESSAENKITKAHMFIIAYVVSVHDCTNAFDMFVVDFLFTLFETGTCFILLYHPMTIPMMMDDMT